MIEVDLAIIGAGPAGLAAATVATAAGLEVALLDDNPRPGGQYLRQPAPAFGRAGVSPYDSESGLAARLFAVLESPRLRWLPAATVWDLPERGVIAFAGGGQQGRVRAAAVLLATGAADRAVPFPGWTLPGVIAAGGLQNLVKGQRVLPGQRFVVAGNGPLLLAVAANVLAAGGELAGVVEAASLAGNLPRVARGLLAQPDLLALGLRHRLALHARGVPLLEGQVVVSVHGDGEGLRSVVVAPLDADGRPRREARRSIACDTLVTGFGLSPATELARLAGCGLRFDARLQAAVPLRDATLESTVPGLWLAGDGAGYGGARVALAEGELAAHAILERLQVPARGARALRALRARLARARRFSASLGRLFETRADWLSLLTPETLVCRCEDVRLLELRRLLREDPEAAPARIKAETRCGLGRCQGRNCLPVLGALLARARGVAPGDIEPPRPRPPARPVLIADLLHEPLSPPPLPPDPHLPRARRS